MSDAGLQAGIYEQLRTIADRLDRALVALRSPQAHLAREARLEIASILHDITDKQSMSPSARFVAVVLKQELPSIAGKGLSEFESLIEALGQRAPSAEELAQLEQVATALDKECAHTLARIKGRG